MDDGAWAILLIWSLFALGMAFLGIVAARDERRAQREEDRAGKHDDRWDV